MYSTAHLKKSGMAPVQHGFTLIEIIIVIAILAILLGIAVPSFQQALLGMKMNSHANSLVSSVYTARSEAIKRNAVVTLCTSTDGVTCASTGGWGQGWIIRCNTVDNAMCDPLGGNSLVLQRQGPVSNGFLMTGRAAGTTTIIRSLSFHPSGVGATPATFTVCFDSADGTLQERIIQVSATGRPAVSKTNSGSCT